MLKKTEKFSSLFRSKQNISDLDKPTEASRTSRCGEASLVTSRCDESSLVTQCYSVTTGKVSTLVRSPSFSTVSTRSSISFDGDGDDESEVASKVTNNSSIVTSNSPIVTNNISLVTNKWSTVSNSSTKITGSSQKSTNNSAIVLNKLPKLKRTLSKSFTGSNSKWNLSNLLKRLPGSS